MDQSERDRANQIIQRHEKIIKLKEKNREMKIVIALYRIVRGESLENFSQRDIIFMKNLLNQRIQKISKKIEFLMKETAALPSLDVIPTMEDNNETARPSKITKHEK